MMSEIYAIKKKTIINNTLLRDNKNIGNIEEKINTKSNAKNNTTHNANWNTNNVMDIDDDNIINQFNKGNKDCNNSEMNNKLGKKIYLDDLINLQGSGYFDNLSKLKLNIQKDLQCDVVTWNKTEIKKWLTR